MFVSRERAYHGVNFGGVALSGIVNNRRKFGPSLTGVAHMRHTHLKETISRRVKRRRARSSPRSAALRRAVRRGEYRRLLHRADRRIDGLPLPPKAT